MLSDPDLGFLSLQWAVGSVDALLWRRAEGWPSRGEDLYVGREEMAVQRAPESALSLLMVSACWNPFGKGGWARGAAPHGFRAPNPQEDFVWAGAWLLQVPGNFAKGSSGACMETFLPRWVLAHLDQCSRQDFEVTFPAELALAFGAYPEQWSFCSLNLCLEFSRPPAFALADCETT